MNKLKISVIMASFNQADFIERSIQSVIAQAYSGLEFIVMDGGSTDGSVEIIKKYEEHIAYWQSESDGGQSAAINAGMALATGDLYCWLNSDDLFQPECLDKVSMFFQANPGANWACGIGSFIKINGSEFCEPVKPLGLNFDSLCLMENHVPQPNVFWRHALWEQVGGLNESLHYAMDYDLWLRFSQLSEGHIIDEKLSIAIMHDDQKTSAFQAEAFAQRCLVIGMNGNIDKATASLARPIKRAFQIGNMFSFITNNSFYRKWKNRNL